MRPPCGRFTKATAQITTATASSIAAMPVMRKRGITVSAGSQPCQAVCGWHGGPIAWITSPPGVALPCRASKKPCSRPSSPAPAPNAAAMMRAVLPFLAAAGLRAGRRVSWCAVGLRLSPGRQR
jgi:hypothetical protein